MIKQTRASAVMIAIIAILLTGCGESMSNPYNSTPEEIADAQAQMRTWPSIEDTEQHLMTTLQQIADAAATIVPALTWEWNRERSQNSCGKPYSNAGGIQVTSQQFVSDVPISEESWPAVLEAARAIAAQAGMPEMNVRVNKPSKHDVMFFGDNGSKIHFGTNKTALIRATTGCRYRAEDLPTPTK